MADDLDDLLDEVESKFVRKKPKSSIARTCSFVDDCDDEDIIQSRGSVEAALRPIASAPSTRHRSRDLDAAIDDIFDDGPVTECRVKSSNAQTDESTVKSSQSSTKCYPLLIGGSSNSTGLSTTVSKQCCSNLRCFNCDFNVEMFDSYRWAPETDYLFLRNNMPDLTKLQSRLIGCRAARAYGCQCQWTTATEMQEITGQLKRLWHCGGKH